MKPPSFDIGLLRQALEARLGARLVRFEMITDCSRPENFRAETEDGVRYAVKCVPPEKSKFQYFRAHFVPHLEELRGTRAIQLVGEPFAFGDAVVVVLAWCGGVRVMPDRLSAAQERELVAAYGEFSSAIQRCSNILAPRDNAAVRAEALSYLTGPACRGLRDFVERELPVAAMAYDPKRMRVIHGDFHHGNFHFDGERITGIMDLEDFRTGYPADDWVRYVVCGAEHLHWYDVAGRRRLLGLFSRLQPLYPADEWRAAVDGLLIRKIWRRFSRRKGSKAWLAANLRFRLGFYRELHARICK